MELQTLCPNEWDVDSFNRKFAHSWVVHINRQTGKLVGTFYNVGVVSTAPDGVIQSAWFNKDGKSESTNYISPIYMRVPSGYYVCGKNEDGYALLIRRSGKQWSLGVGHKTHNTWFVKGNLLLDHEPGKGLWPILHKPLVCNVEKAVEEGGPLSSTLFMTKNFVYFLDQKVGLRNKKDKIIVSSFITQEVFDVLKGTKCQLTNG